MAMPSIFPFCEVDPKPGDLADMRFILLNGPPGSGKDTAGKILMGRYGYESVSIGKFSKRLKESVHSDHGYSHLPHDYFEDCKDDPLPLFFGKSPRQAYIFKSEVMVKPHFGDQYYGRLYLRDALAAYRLGSRMIAVTDSGFASEVQPLIEVVGLDSIFLVHIHAEARGKTFANDSRSYLDLPGVRTVDLINNRLDYFQRDLIEAMHEWRRERLA